MLALAYDAALRREELCSLRTDDLDPAHFHPEDPGGDDEEPARRARLSARLLHRVSPARQLPTTHSAACESLVATGSAVRSTGFVKCSPSGAIGSGTATTHCCRW